MYYSRTWMHLLVRKVRDKVKSYAQYADIKSLEIGIWPEKLKST